MGVEASAAVVPAHQTRKTLRRRAAPALPRIELRNGYSTALHVSCLVSLSHLSLSLSLYVFVTGLYHIVLLTLSVRQICVDLCMSWIFCFVKTVKNVISSVDITLKIPGIIHFQIILYLSRQKLFCAEKFEGRICIKFSDDLHTQL